jgi:hypothetical protein
VYVRECFDDIPKRFILRSLSVNGDYSPNAPGNVFEMVDQFDTVVAVFGRM